MKEVQTMAETMSLTVNGAARSVDVAEGESLLSVLRERLGLTGAKIGCAEGACGACSVLVDGQLARSCVTPAAAVAGRHVLTIEGLAGTTNDQRPTTNEWVSGEDSHPSSLVVGPSSARLHPLQRAFIDNGAFQCGYCTPGMLMAGAALLAQHPHPDEATIARYMQGNICRCGMYARIVRAIQQAAAEPAGGSQ
jgi:aerobic-type carbon monoxide dehydrogenase small subunit (CoxS/CutS family)